MRRFMQLRRRRSGDFTEEEIGGVVKVVEDRDDDIIKIPTEEVRHSINETRLVNTIDFGGEEEEEVVPGLQGTLQT